MKDSVGEGKVNGGAHGQESMNFFQEEYDAGASLASTQRWDHSTCESSSRTSKWVVTTDIIIYLHSVPEFTFGGTLEPCQILPFEASFEIVNRAGVSTTALECD
jgi:hypothetical protein